MLKIKDHSILVIPSSIKNNVIKEIRKQGLYDVKFMTMDELISKVLFSYNNETIYYLITKYHYKYDVAKMYLDNLYYLTADNHNNSKLIHLSNLKEELSKENLLISDKLFLNTLKNKEIIVWGYNNLSNYYINFLAALKKITNVIIVNKPKKKYSHQTIYEFNTIDEEINFVAESICHNLSENISLNNIKLYIPNSEYNNSLKRIFKLYNLKININNTTLYGTKIVNFFLDNLDSDINITLSKVEEKFNLKNPHILETYNTIINILNSYTFCNDYLTIKEMLVHDFKNTQIDIHKTENTLEIINNLDNVNDDDYIYLLGFNQSDIPKTYKDEDYLSDSIKELINLDTSKTLNQKSISNWLDNINSIKNLIISYKLSSTNNTYYISSLNDYLNLSIKRISPTYMYSNSYNKLILANKIDTLIKYNEKDEYLDKLFNTYPNLPYNSYNNKFTPISSSKLKNYLNHKLVLSYSTLNDYYHCSFKYYLSNILKLNIFNETFMTILGNLFHYILSICFQKDIDLSLEYDKYLSKLEYQFSSKEEYFLDNLKEELQFIIDTIKEQYTYNTLNNFYYEEKIIIDKSQLNMEIIFKGFIDKLILDENNTVASIIDYKTGNPNLNLNNAIYGLDLQLPVYIYLTKKRFPNIEIIGFYLQKILNNKIKRDYKHTYLENKKDNLKLQGYTNKNENLIKLFDTNYNESKVIKGMKTTSKGLGTKKVLDSIEIDKLADLVDIKIDEAIANITKGEFSINPKSINNENIGCKYCKYQDICYMTENDIINLKEHKNLDFLTEEAK